MLSIGSLSSAAGAAAYYIKGGEGQISGYYAAHQQASKWAGSAKDYFALKDGPVDLKVFEALLDGQVSDTQTLGRKVKGVRLRDPGRDFTFSAPKSVSLAAIGHLEKPIIEAFAGSVAVAMDYYEKHFAQAKVWNNDLKRQVKTGDQKIIYATFLDNLSREKDPQIHMHVPVPSIGIGADGNIRSLNFDLAYKHKILLGNIQRAAFAKELKAMGLSIRPAGKNGLWELEGSDRQVLKNFSKRRQEMEKVGRHGLHDPKAMAHIAKTTRPQKSNISPTALKARWAEEFKQIGTSIAEFTQALLEGSEVIRYRRSAKEAIGYAISHMSETEHHIDRHVLLKHAMISEYGNIDIKTMEAELKIFIEKGELLASEDGRWLKPAKTQELETALITEMEKGHLKAKVLTARDFGTEVHRLEGLTPGQTTAAELILTDRHRLNGVEGIAGTGKTYFLAKTLPIFKEKGYQLIGLAPTLKATTGLEAVGVFDKTMTVQKFQMKPTGNAKTVLVVDEAGMVGNEIMHSILHHANNQHMPKVVLIGDTEQLPPIEAGRPFEHLIKHGLRTVRMKDVVRQKSAHHRKGVVELSNQDIRAAFQTLKKEIHEVPRDRHIEYALELREKMSDPSIVVNTNAQRQAINLAISEQGENQNRGRKQKIWAPVYMTKTQRTRVANYEGATHIRFARNVGKDFKRGEIYRIAKIDHHTAQIHLANKNGAKTYTPARHGSGESFTQIYKQSEITLHKGDRVKFRQTDKTLGIKNNDLGEIFSLNDKRIRIAIKGDSILEKVVTLPTNHRMLSHLDHAWANTTYSFQGITVKDNIAIMPADNNPLTTLEALYVGGSRHKDSLAIITDDKDRLLNIIAEKLEIKKQEISFQEPNPMGIVDPKPLNIPDLIEKSKTTDLSAEQTEPTRPVIARGQRSR